jgi:hypothetical protein
MVYAEESRRFLEWLFSLVKVMAATSCPVAEGSVPMCSLEVKHLVSDFTTEDTVKRNRITKIDYFTSFYAAYGGHAISDCIKSKSALSALMAREVT